MLNNSWRRLIKDESYCNTFLLIERVGMKRYLNVSAEIRGLDGMHRKIRLVGRSRTYPLKVLKRDKFSSHFLTLVNLSG
jgi:hypothetical protein